MTCSGVMPALTKNVVIVKRPTWDKWCPPVRAAYNAFMHGGKAAMAICLGISSVLSLPFLSIRSCLSRSARTASSSGSCSALVLRRFSMCLFTSSSKRRVVSFFVSCTLPLVTSLLMSFHSFS